MTTVSIILPINSTKFLDQAIESVLKQNFDHSKMELLIIFQGLSRHEILSFIPAKSSVSIKLIENLQDGLVSSLNMGLTVAKGEFISRIDGDDVMMETRIAKQIDYLESNPEIWVVGGHIALIDERSNMIKVKKYQISDAIIRARILEESPVAHPAVTFRKTKIQDIGGYRNLTSEDTDLWLRVLKLGKISNLDEVVINYRVHQNQLTQLPINQSAAPRNAVWLSHFLRENLEVDMPNSPNSELLWVEENLNRFKRNWRERLIFSQRWAPQSQMNMYLAELKAKTKFNQIVALGYLLSRHPFMVASWLRFKVLRLYFVSSYSYKKIGF